jgi:putative methyltransferase (TIGR04325 family)
MRALAWARRALARLAPAPSARWRAYASFHEALHDSEGYGNPALVDVVARKTEALRTRLSENPPIRHRLTVQNLLVLSSLRQPGGLHVLELGGACGASFFELDHFLPGRIESWSIVETKAMAEAGRRGFECARLRFFSDLEDAARSLGHHDLFAAQGSLQYVPDPLEPLRRADELGFRHVYVSRTAVIDGTSPLYTRQETRLADHGPGPLARPGIDRTTTQPLTLIPAGALLAAAARSYRVVFAFEDDEPAELMIGRRPVTVRSLGVLAERTQR